MKKYAVVIERGPHNLSAYMPDLPGCVTTGKTVQEIERNIREAVELHVEGMIEDGDPFPSRRLLSRTSNWRLPDWRSWKSRRVADIGEALVIIR